MMRVNNQKGIILIYVLLVISLITAIAITVSIIIINELRITTTATDATLAYYAAEAGIERGLHTVKIKRNEAGMTISGAIIDIKALQASLDNDTEYDNDLSESQTSEIRNEELREDQYIQADYYNVDNPLQPSGVVSIRVENTGNNPASWAEVAWTAWNSSGTLGTSTSALRVIGPTDLQTDDGWPINLDVFDIGFDPVGYRVRIKALFGDLSDLAVIPYNDSGGEVSELPSQVEIKAVGTKGKLKQSLTALVPWEIPLHGLYDYVLFSEEGLAKTIIVSREIYTSGAIQVESNLEGSCSGCQFYDLCPDWLAVCCAEDVACTVDSSGGVCAVDDTEVSEEKISDHWVLPIPDYVPAGDEYYLSMRAKYTGGEVEITLGDTCKVVPDQASSEWFSCTIPNPDFSTMPNTNLQFKHIGSGSIDIDWYQLSSYKIFEDCSGIITCATPAPDCGNCICEEGEDCDFDDIDCTTELVCQTPVCSNGCQTEDIDDDVDPLCMGGSRCCSGICEPMDPPLYCDSDVECGDGLCYTNDTCTAPGFCASECSHVDIGCGADDGCCGPTCDSVNDPDCVGVPEREYLRYIAYDESGNGLASMPPQGDPGKSMRVIPAWERQYTGSVWLRDVWAADANNVWAVGNSGTILHSDDGGSTWGSQNSNTGQTLRGVFGLDSLNIWAVGASGAITYYNGSWTVLPAFTTSRLNAVWAYNVNNVWVVADEIDAGDGIVWYCNSNCTNASANWAQQRVTGLNQHLNAIWGLSNTSIWAAGDAGKIVYYDGSWSGQNSCTSSILYGISGVDSSNIWAVGDGGTICKFNTPTWEAQTTGGGEYLYDVAAYSEYGLTGVLVGGGSGEAFYSDGSSNQWSKQGGTGFPSTDNFRGVFAYDYDNIWGVGYEGDIVHVNLPGAMIHVGKDSSGGLLDQYWLSREFNNITLPDNSGGEEYIAHLYVPSKTYGGGDYVWFVVEAGYCDDTGGTIPGICNEAGDFRSKAASAPFQCKGSSCADWLNGVGGIPLDTPSWVGTHLCTSADPCRLWFGIRVTSTNVNLGNYFELSVSGTTDNNSFLDVPAP